MKPWRNKKYLAAAATATECTLCRRQFKPGELCAAHIRLPGFCGTGQKPPDFMSVLACRECHDWYGDMNRPEDASVVLRALCRTLQRGFESEVLHA